MINGFFCKASFRIISTVIHQIFLGEVDMRFHIILTGLTCILLTGTASAAGVPIDPGMWEMTSTMTMSVMPQPRSTTVSKCIEEDEISPENFEMDDNNPCNFTDVIIEGNKARWSINCPTDAGMVMEGQWEFTSSGDSITGSGSMSTVFSGQTMGFDMTWEGKRIGDCD